jgi:diguanylate cyclase (GGDEF)-like protein
MVEQGRYAGFMGSIAILRAVHEKNLAAARDQNPLTRLPGNLSIGDWVAEALADTGTGRVLAYFDFDNFKPFNDSYGFRQGDRAIQLFAELMQKAFGGGDTFLGHVGGDDFFAGFTGPAAADVQAEVGALLDRFRHEVESFYEPEARRRGFLEATGRDGLARRFGLLTCSAGLLVLPAGRPAVAVDRAMAEIARLKKTAKAGGRRLAVSELAG